MAKRRMKIIVIGGNGFLGSAFSRLCALAGHNVEIVARRANSPRSVSHPRITINYQGLEGLVVDHARLAAADVICQFASSAVPATSNRDPKSDIRNNLLLNIDLLEAMRESGAKRLVYLSSGGAVYGRAAKSPIVEMTPLYPISSYGIVKGAVEHYINIYAEQHGLRPLIVRPANPYGPGQSTAKQVGLIAAVIEAAVQHKEAVIYGDGSIVRDFIYIDDLCKFILSSIEADVVGTFNCGSGAGFSINAIIDAVEQVCGYVIAVKRLALRAIDPPKIVLDISRARAAVDWAPSTCLEDGIRASWIDAVRYRNSL